MSSTQPSGTITFRHPTLEDGAAIWQLVKDAGTLDLNSCYAYMLLCREFGHCCAVAERDGRLEGFVTGLLPPTRPDTWFLWQVGVAATARGEGLARRMALFILEAVTPERGPFYLETTVTRSNEASRALFKGIARRLDTELEESDLFTSDMFPGEGYEAEPLLRIGPFDAAAVRKAKEA